MITVAGGILLAVTAMVLVCRFPVFFGRALQVVCAITALGACGFFVVIVAQLVTT